MYSPLAATENLGQQKTEKTKQKSPIINFASSNQVTFQINSSKLAIHTSKKLWGIL